MYWILLVILSLADSAGQGAKDVAAAYVKLKYPELATGAGLARLASPAAAKLMPDAELYAFSVGGMYPIATMGPHVRRVLVVDDKKHEVVLDFDATLKDDDAQAALRDFLPRATAKTAADVAAMTATLAPLDPFFSNPGAPRFAVKKVPGGKLRAVWSGAGFQYEIDFASDGKLADLERKDRRPKPICFEHRARAQALLDREHPGLRAGDVIWDELTAARVPGFYVYEVLGGRGERAGLVAVEKGPGAARFASAADAAALIRDVLTPAAGADLAAAGQVAFGLLRHAGASTSAPLGPEWLTVHGPQVRWQGYVLHFASDGHLQP
jgi:hypothetical protein